MAEACKKLRNLYSWDPHVLSFELFFSPTADNGSKVVDMAGLSCPGDENFHHGTPFLSFIGCKRTVGSGLHIYPAREIISRLMAWKAPLVQLIFQFPRPPLSTKVQFLVMFHLVGDPIDTIASILYTLAVCQSRADALRNIMPEGDWEALVLIMVSYEESGNMEACEELERL